MAGNKFTDKLAKSTASLSDTLMAPHLIHKLYGLTIHPQPTDLHKLNYDLNTHFVTWYRNNISPTIPPQPWCHNLNLSRKCIISFSRLRFGHTLLSSHSFELSLNEFLHTPSSILSIDIVCAFYDITHLIFNCPPLQRTHLSFILKSFNIPFNIQNVFSYQKKTL